MILNLTMISIITILEIMIVIVRHPSISVKQTVAESNISEVFLLPLRLSATVLRIERRNKIKRAGHWVFMAGIKIQCDM